MLAVMRIDGFLQNLDQQYEEADIEAPQWGAFLERWHERFGETPVTVAELVEELEQNASALYPDQTLRACAPDDVLEAIAARGGGNQRLGQLLRYRKDTRYPVGVRAGPGRDQGRGGAVGRSEGRVGEPTGTGDGRAVRRRGDDGATGGSGGSG